MAPSANASASDEPPTSNWMRVGAAPPPPRALPGTRDRPTPAEEQEALEVIRELKKSKVIGLRARPSSSVVACSIALWRGEHFGNDRAALRLFGAHPETKLSSAAWFAKLDASRSSGSVLMCSRVPGGRAHATAGSGSSDPGRSVWSATATRVSASGRRRTRGGAVHVR